MKKIRKYIDNSNLFFENLLEKINPRRINFNSIKQKAIDKIYVIIFLFVLLPILYISIPGIIDKDIIKFKFKENLNQNFDINFDLDTEVNYKIFPKPHFHFKNVNIFKDENNFGNIQDLRLLVSLKDLLDIKSIKIKRIILENSELYLDHKDIIFFDNFLKGNLLNKDLIIRNTEIFFQNIKKETLFIKKLNKAIFYYDKKNQRNNFKNNVELFNISNNSEFFYSNNFEKLNFKSNFDQLDLTIEGVSSLKENNGFIDIDLASINLPINYQLEKNQFIFSHKHDSLKIFTNKTNQQDFNEDFHFKGVTNLKPFYLNLLIFLNQLSLEDLFNNNSLTVEVLKTQILNDERLNYDLSISANKLKKYSSIKDISIKLNSLQGVIDLNNTNFQYDDNITITIDDSILSFRDNDVTLDCKLIFQIKDLNSIYRNYQTPKKNRVQFSSFEVLLDYSFVERKINFKKIEVDNKNNENLNKSLISYNEENDFLKNKIEFKKFINNLFEIYSDG